MSRRKEPSIPAALLDQLLAGSDAGAALQDGRLFDSLKKALAERALNAEMDHHLDQDSQDNNSRNGYGRKTVTTDGGKIEIEVPRDRAGSFDPQLIAKYQRRFPGFDDKIISMYARGMSTREISGHLRELYGNRPVEAACRELKGGVRDVDKDVLMVVLIGSAGRDGDIGAGAPSSTRPVTATN